MPTKKRICNVQYIESGLQLPRHAFQTQHICDERGIIPIDGHAVAVHELHHLPDHDSHVEFCAVPFALFVAHGTNVGHKSFATATLFLRELQHPVGDSAPVSVTDSLEESDEVPALLGGKVGGHARVQQHKLRFPKDAGPPKDEIPRMEICMHKVVNQEHLQIDVLAARYHEMCVRPVHLQASPHKIRRKLSGLVTLHEHSWRRKQHLRKDHPSSLAAEVVTESL
mmetsp:Transcript_59463/g.150692  ORF Transcript_59463/g.150692 Transcript_59463/m.150692 type:complete len:225 (-) Transcript_59463:79-753(-)